MLSLVALTVVLAAALDGRVVEDHSGNPVVSVEVRVLRNGAPGVVAELETDGDGHFGAQDLPAGDYRLELSKSNYMRVTVEAHADSVLQIRMLRYGVISGQVTDEQGQPVRDADVLAFTKPAGSGPLQATDFAVRTDEQGEYRLHHLPPGEYVAAASWGASTRAVGASGRAMTDAKLGSGFLFYPGNTRPQFFTVTSGDEHRADFMLQPAASVSLSGKVEAPASGDAGRFWIALTPVDQPALAVAVTQAAADGSFHFESVPSGSYQLFASGPINMRIGKGGLLGDEPLYGLARVDVAGENVEGLSVAVDKGGSVTFLLRRGSLCPSTASVRLVPLEDHGAAKDWSAELTAGTPRTVNRIAPGRYQLELKTPGNACYLTSDPVVAVAGSSTVEILTAPAGSIQGHLTADAAAVTLYGGEDVRMALPDADHKFAFTGLRPGHYRLVTGPQNKIEVDVHAGAPTVVELANAQ
jgi:5-hydroxyisourate hydrolase-like protein (transthyretin family)